MNPWMTIKRQSSSIDSVSHSPCLHLTDDVTIDFTVHYRIRQLWPGNLKVISILLGIDSISRSHSRPRVRNLHIPYMWSLFFLNGLHCLFLVILHFEQNIWSSGNDPVVALHKPEFHVVARWEVNPGMPGLFCNDSFSLMTNRCFFYSQILAKPVIGL